ncbi:MAG TPA: hypothetical protein VH134_15665 [Candidatus Dormibacteraeota bacterium]|jgi:hypothetical protein|nr:hypothetical protein [Candidatus Dormibacteraeota bacterium]
MTPAAPRPRDLLLPLLLVVLAAAVTTPVVVALTRPVVHEWADTVGFTAGVAAACLAIRGVLARLG